MYLLLCEIWPYLAGGLLGWLLSGWLARRLKYAETPKERIVEVKKEIIVEKAYDNPELVEKVGLLQKENAQITDLKAQLAQYEHAEPENADNAELLQQVLILEESNMALQEENRRITELEAEITRLEEQNSGKIDINTRSGEKQEENDKIVFLQSKADQQEADPVRKKVELEKAIDNSELQQKIERLEADNKSLKKENQRILEQQSKVTSLESHKDDTKYLRKIYALKEANRILQKRLEQNESQLRDSDNQSGIEKQTDTPERIKEPKQELDYKAAKAAGFKIRGRDNNQHDFTVIEGIGPKINDLIHNADIHTFAVLAGTSVGQLHQILEDAGPDYQHHDPGTWPEQSALAAANQWAELKKRQDELDGGKESS